LAQRKRYNVAAESFRVLETGETRVIEGTQPVRSKSTVGVRERGSGVSRR
jgi:hypothetical protein